MSDAQQVQQGDAIPHFKARTIAGELFGYATVWQRKNLVLLLLQDSESEASAAYVSELVSYRPTFTAMDAELVVTRDHVAGIGCPGVVVADRWGEIVHVAAASRVEQLTPPDQLVEWLDYVVRRCPECEGEAR